MKKHILKVSFDGIMVEVMSSDNYIEVIEFIYNNNISDDVICIISNYGV